MAQALVELQRAHPFTFEVVDVDADQSLVERYDELVPVLVYQGQELCHYFLNREAVLKVIGFC